ncbi:MAG: sigma-70 family RNA polymerase sigma factor [Lachnospiraceae bacterium]|nr:sigma-70 family RNA polymerase sigma factor [Lachnospiraceae bacterium]MBP3568974.1 sigma-70 family RNA polymerase sigma factor [Lachnospiraceae bacterium]
MQSFPQPLSTQEEEQLLQGMFEGNPSCRNRLIEHNLRLVAHVVKKYSNTGYETDDLISIGTIGLIKAVDSFNQSKGIRLATYASRCIENAILSQMRLWWRTSCPRAEKNQNGVFWRRFPRIFTSFAPLRTAM